MFLLLKLQTETLFFVFLDYFSYFERFEGDLTMGLKNNFISGSDDPRRYDNPTEQNQKDSSLRFYLVSSISQE